MELRLESMEWISRSSFVALVFLLEVVTVISIMISRNVFGTPSSG
jgi:hypothetical protein